MTALVRGELIKTASTRTAAVYAVLALALAVAGVLLTILPASGELRTLADKKEAIAGAPILMLLLALVGAAGEYRHRTAAPAALVSGRGASQLLLPRAAAYAIAGMAIAAPALVVTLAIGLPLLAGEPGPALAVGDIALVAVGTLVAAAISAIIGVAVGALVRNQVAAVTGTLVFVFIVLPLVQVASPAAVNVTPVGAGAGLAGAHLDHLSWSAAGFVLAGWAVGLMLAAIASERSRDLA
jgi:ABC-2 type transport system permease protein